MFQGALGWTLNNGVVYGDDASEIASSPPALDLGTYQGFALRLAAGSNNPNYLAIGNQFTCGQCGLDNFVALVHLKSMCQADEDCPFLPVNSKLCSRAYH